MRTNKSSLNLNKVQTDHPFGKMLDIYSFENCLTGTIVAIGCKMSNHLQNQKWL